jgi:AP-3 complex subunit delta-1
MTWSEFYVIETIADPLFVNKRIAYAAANVAFSGSPDRSSSSPVLTLATNQFKKDLHSINFLYVEVANKKRICFGAPLSGTYPNGRTGNRFSSRFRMCILNNLQIHLLSHSRSHIRKRAVLVLYKTFLKFPASLPTTYPRLKDMLQDVDMGVVSSAVNVICELSLNDPKSYVTLAPVLFDLLTRPKNEQQPNNWLLIKIVKLVCSLIYS